MLQLISAAEMCELVSDSGLGFNQCLYYSLV